MKKHNFQHWQEAILIMQNCSDPAGAGAISLIHEGVATCAGLPFEATRFVRLPIVSLDLTWFYKAIESIISGWKELNDATDDVSDEAGLSLVDPLLPELDCGGKNALRKFAVAISACPRPVPVDESYCVWLFAETILRHNLLPKVLDGSISKWRIEREKASFDEWATTWQ